MSAYSPLLQDLIDSLRCLPGVGPKSAQRMAFHILERDREGGRRLTETLQRALTGIGHCNQCRMFSETDICPICSSPQRDTATVCVVESPADVAAVEQSAAYRGTYFVLMGHLSPLDGIGPDELGLDRLEARLDDGGISELILATNPTVEGETTALFINRRLQSMGVEVSRPASGIPVGGELATVDQLTLAQALQLRRKV